MKAHRSKYTSSFQLAIDLLTCTRLLSTGGKFPLHNWLDQVTGLIHNTTNTELVYPMPHSPSVSDPCQNSKNVHVTFSKEVFAE